MGELLGSLTACKSQTRGARCVSWQHGGSWLAQIPTKMFLKWCLQNTKKNPVGARNMNEFPTTEVLEELDGQLVMLPLARIYLISFDPFLFQGVMAGIQFENLTVSVVFYDSFSASVQVSRKKKSEVWLSDLARRPLLLIFVTTYPYKVGPQVNLQVTRLIIILKKVNIKLC